MLSTFNPEDLLKAAHTANITEDCANAMLFILEAPLPKGLDFYNWKLQCKLTFLKSLTAYIGFYNNFTRKIFVVKIAVHRMKLLKILLQL